MSLHRRNPATDENALMIIKALRSIGATVQPIIGTGKGGTPDALCGYKGETYLLEFKKTLTTPKGKALKRAIRPSQEAWHAAWRGKPVSVVDSVAGAFIAVGSPYAVQLQRVFDKPKKTVKALPGESKGLLGGVEILMQLESQRKPKKTKTQQWAALGLSVFGDKPKKGQSNEENHENKT